MLNREEIKNIIPHREPMLLLDSANITSYTTAKGTWVLTGEEEFFKGHYPSNPIVPGVLIIESLAQLGAVLLLDREEFKGKTPLFAGIDKVRFKHMVKPGDILSLHVELEEVRRGIGYGNVHAMVEDKIACEARIMFAVK